MHELKDFTKVQLLEIARNHKDVVKNFSKLNKEELYNLLHNLNLIHNHSSKPNSPSIMPIISNKAKMAKTPKVLGVTKTTKKAKTTKTPNVLGVTKSPKKSKTTTGVPKTPRGAKIIASRNTKIELKQMKKAELVALANTLNLETKNFTKDDLIKKILKSGYRV